MKKKVLFLAGISCVVCLGFAGCQSAAPTPDNVAKQVIKSGAVQVIKNAK